MSAKNRGETSSSLRYKCENNDARGGAMTLGDIPVNDRKNEERGTEKRKNHAVNYKARARFW